MRESIDWRRFAPCLIHADAFCTPHEKLTPLNDSPSLGCTLSWAGCELFGPVRRLILAGSKSGFGLCWVRLQICIVTKSASFPSVSMQFDLGLFSCSHYLYRHKTCRI
eukprot:TRINITY_DN1916_c4_g1_i1.p1 TRINITY_DN1916_c4_g1~~TRINITY_DN1916_c4_g1_i1.p1  ORF type:complete len:108 (+),score=4.79 TRINITY_DN1916_c4_g1_i1:239-562(+)